MISLFWISVKLEHLQAPWGAYLCISWMYCNWNNSLVASFMCTLYCSFILCYLLHHTFCTDQAETYQQQVGDWWLAGGVVEGAEAPSGQKWRRNPPIDACYALAWKQAGSRTDVQWERWRGRHRASATGSTLLAPELNLLVTILWRSVLEVPRRADPLVLQHKQHKENKQE